MYNQIEVLEENSPIVIKLGVDIGNSFVNVCGEMDYYKVFDSCLVENYGAEFEEGDNTITYKDRNYTVSQGNLTAESAPRRDLNNYEILGLFAICRYIKEYRNRGYKVTKLTMQNEPKAIQPWDSCVYTALEQKEFLKELKLVYAASTKTEAEIALKKLEENWAKKYPIVIQSWKEKWDKLSCYFDYPSEIRRIIYTTNTVEGYHRQIRKVTKTKGLFPNDDSLVKLVYLAYRNIKKKWKKPLQNWTTCVQKLSILFGQRFNPLNLNQIPK